MSLRTLAMSLLAAFGTLAAMPLSATEAFDIGLAGSGTRIDAIAVEPTAKAAPTVVLVGGLHGNDASAAAVRAAVTAYEHRRSRPVRLLAVPVANPDAAALAFPPSGVAYRENAERDFAARMAVRPRGRGRLGILALAALAIAPPVRR